MRIERTIALLAGQRAAILIDEQGRRWVAPLHEREGRWYWRPAEVISISGDLHAEMQRGPAPPVPPVASLAEDVYGD